MKNLGAATAFLTVIMLANVVAAGVIALLAGLVKDVAPWADNETWPWVIVALVGITCAIAFLRGAIEMLASASRFKGKRHVTN